jgi:hypothetical protein
VCKKCNNDLGRYVDAKFIKSFFYKQYYALGSYEYLDITKVKFAPLIYWGKLDKLNMQDNMICELWGSPCGGRILHIHEKSPEEFDGYAGGDPKTTREEPGIAIFVNANTNQDKIILGLRSFARYFKESRRYLANIKFSVLENYKIIGELPDENINKIIEQFLEVCPFDENGHQVISPSNAIYLDSDNRLLAKIGIGLTFNILGNSYLNSKSYDRLFKILWGKSLDNDLMMANFHTGNKLELYEDFSWKGGIVLTFYKLDDKILLLLNIYEHLTFIEIYNESIDGSAINFNKYFNKVFIIIPIIDECVETSAFDFLYYKKAKFDIPILMDLDRKRTSYKPYDTDI